MEPCWTKGIGIWEFYPFFSRDVQIGFFISKPFAVDQVIHVQGQTLESSAELQGCQIEVTINNTFLM